MLHEMSVKKFTVFSDETFTFGRGLNVIVGENSVGKSHALKLAYAMIATSAEAGSAPENSAPTKTLLQKAYGKKLMGVFRPEALGRLASRKQGRARSEICLTFSDATQNCAISFATSAKNDVQVDTLPINWDRQSPLYIPTRELLTIYPGFVSLYDGHYLEFEQTWRDTCSLLGRPALRGPRAEEAAKLVKPIEKALGGKVLLNTNGRFYLKIPGSGEMEMPLVAEGYRKLAMLAHLIVNGVIQEQGYLFWDEPEANLNPKLILLTAQAIYDLAASGVQVFIATHSIFLLRELEIIEASRRHKANSIRYFGLHRTENGVQLVQGDQIEDIGEIVALEERLKQADRYLAMGN